MPAPRGHFDVERELPGVGLREKRPAQERIDRQARHEDTEKQSQRQRRDASEQRRTQRS